VGPRDTLEAVEKGGNLFLVTGIDPRFLSLPALKMATIPTGILTSSTCRTRNYAAVLFDLVTADVKNRPLTEDYNLLGRYDL
jgi:hypothetical protein